MLQCAHGVTMNQKTTMTALTTYLREILDINLSVQRWSESSRLPVFLQESYQYYVGRVHETDILFMVDSGKQERAPSVIGKHVKLLGDRPLAAYVCPHMTSYNRQRLIRKGIQFIVPGNQLYLPALAMDLREYYRRSPPEGGQFSPATQTVLLHWLYNSTNLAWKKASVTEMARILGYSKMTISRAFHEIEQIFTDSFSGYTIGDLWENRIPKVQVWKNAQPHFRSPVTRRHYVTRGHATKHLNRYAGLDALASYSMLAAPPYHVYAVDRREWKKLQSANEIQILRNADDGCVQVEVWNYSPGLFHNHGKQQLVDPLSLYLSLRDTTDVRIEQALEELEGGIRW